MNYKFILLLVIIHVYIISIFSNNFHLNSEVKKHTEVINRNKFFWNDIEKFEGFIREIYEQCELDGRMEYNVFRLAIVGYVNINQHLFKKKIITIIDYTKPSAEKRLYTIDLKSRKVLYHTLVAHAENSGGNFAEFFSNEFNSRKNSLGFYTTAETYRGRHGYSLRLDGRESHYNSNTRNRAIVIHGADYVSRDYMNKHGMLGRSGGCPVLPINKSKKIIDIIKNGSCLFIYYNDPEYLSNSKYLDADNALKKYMELKNALF